MEPVKFPEQNFTFTKPSSMTDEECESLPCHRTDNYIISCWQMSWRERIRFFFTGKMWLWIVGQRMPPVSVTPMYPFRAKEVGILPDLEQEEAEEVK